MSTQSESIHDRIELSIGRPQLVINNEDILLVKKVREFLENNDFDHSIWPDEDIIHILKEKANPRMEVMAAATYIMDADDVPDQWVQVKSKKTTKSKEKKNVQEHPKKIVKPQNTNTQRRVNQNEKSTANKTHQSRKQPTNRKNFQKNSERPTTNIKQNNTKPNNINNNLKPNIENKPIENKPRKEYKGWDSKNETYVNSENNRSFVSENAKPVHVKEERNHNEPSQTPQFEEQKQTDNFKQGSSQIISKTQETVSTKVVMPSFDIPNSDEFKVNFGGPITNKPSNKPEINMPQQPQPVQQFPTQTESVKGNEQNMSDKMINPPPGGFTIPPYMTPTQPSYNQMPFIPPTQGYTIHGYAFDDQRMNFFGYESYNQIPTYHMSPNNMNSNVNTVGNDVSQTTRSNTQDKTQNTGKPNGFFNNSGNPTHPYPFYNPYYVIPQNTSFQHPSQYTVQSQSNQYMRYSNSNNYGKQRSQYNSEDSYNTQ